MRRIRTLQQLLAELVSDLDELSDWEMDRLVRLADSLQTRLQGRIKPVL